MESSIGRFEFAITIDTKLQCTGNLIKAYPEYNVHLDIIYSLEKS